MLADVSIPGVLGDLLGLSVDGLGGGDGGLGDLASGDDGTEQHALRFVGVRADLERVRHGSLLG